MSFACPSFLICSQVLSKLQLSGACQVIKLEKALAHLSLTHEGFLNMCIAAGYDYLPNVRGIGIHSAKQLVTEGNNFLAVLQSNKHAPGEYTSGFQTANKAIFLHQTVINPADGTTIPLSPWGETPDSQSQTSCGMYPLKYYLYLVYVGGKNTSKNSSC